MQRSNKLAVFDTNEDVAVKYNWSTKALRCQDTVSIFTHKILKCVLANDGLFTCLRLLHFCCALTRKRQLNSHNCKIRSWISYFQNVLLQIPPKCVSIPIFCSETQTWKSKAWPIFPPKLPIPPPQCHVGVKTTTWSRVWGRRPSPPPVRQLIDSCRGMRLRKSIMTTRIRCQSYWMTMITDDPPHFYFAFSLQIWVLSFCC